VVYSRGANHILLAHNQKIQKLLSIPRHLRCLGLAPGETKGSNSRLKSTKEGFMVACGNSIAVLRQPSGQLGSPIVLVLRSAACEKCCRADRSWAQSSWPPRFCTLIGSLRSPAGVCVRCHWLESRTWHLRICLPKQDAERGCVSFSGVAFEDCVIIFKVNHAGKTGTYRGCLFQ
jgi:hypothetical protein